MRWVTRLLGVISIATLARLLEKADFSLVSLLWHLSGFPEGLERLVVERVRLMRNFA